MWVVGFLAGGYQKTDYLCESSSKKTGRIEWHKSKEHQRQFSDILSSLLSKVFVAMRHFLDKELIEIFDFQDQSGKSDEDL